MSMTGSDTTAEVAGGTWSGGKTKQSGRDVWDGVEWIMFSMIWDEPGAEGFKCATPRERLEIVDAAMAFYLRGGELWATR